MVKKNIIREFMEEIVISIMLMLLWTSGLFGIPLITLFLITGGRLLEAGIFFVVSIAVFITIIQRLS